MALDDKTRKLIDIFLSYDRERQRELSDAGCHLAHYTTAETAVKIIRNRCLWLRNAAVMNDFSEVEHGRSVMKFVLDAPLGAQFKAALDGIEAGLADRVFKRHFDHQLHGRETVFIASLSEHDSDDELGRLSMWRAYGGPVAGVALLFDSRLANLEIESSLAIDVSPVRYSGSDKFGTEFQTLLTRISENLEFLKTLNSRPCGRIWLY